jgi:hypothetical protein
MHGGGKEELQKRFRIYLLDRGRQAAVMMATEEN